MILQVSKGARAYTNHLFESSWWRRSLCPSARCPAPGHGPDFETCKSCIDGASPRDGLLKPFAENIEITRKVVEYAHHGVVVEAELGALAGVRTTCRSPPSPTTPIPKRWRSSSQDRLRLLAIAIGTSSAYKFYRLVHPQRRAISTCLCASTFWTRSPAPALDSPSCSTAPPLSPGVRKDDHENGGKMPDAVVF